MFPEQTLPYICKFTSDGIAATSTDIIPEGGHWFIEQWYPRATGIEIHAKVVRISEHRLTGRGGVAGQFARTSARALQLLSGNNCGHDQEVPWNVSVLSLRLCRSRGESLSSEDRRP